MRSSKSAGASTPGDEDDPCDEEARLLSALAAAFGQDATPAIRGALRRAAECWRSGDKALAVIRLAQVSLCKIDAADADRFRVAAILLARMRARGFGEHQPGVSKYNDNQPRVPAGNGRASGQWTHGDAGGNAPLVEGRSINRDHKTPKDAVAVVRPDGAAIDDLHSLTGKLMAPPSANFREVYAAGARSWNPIRSTLP